MHQAMSNFNSHSGKPYQLSCSLGIVFYDTSTPPDLEQLLRQADEEMYVCKVQR
ncbi:MAG: diguanylate cyclase domain-containing protein [Plesiomonas shigelloides]